MAPKVAVTTTQRWEVEMALWPWQILPYPVFCFLIASDEAFAVIVNNENKRRENEKNDF